ncbi:hypothetical protein LSTR_LSTR002984 [Laodelphax striatellus]|uniref:EB domain-containing protein n=1 Tax=Laodelphax striatellus TaxID=195883 RepID=A0A482WSE7_LAOST|nr:hypothetical protein LSTR_LSTR002984 [Laodelphax striatellus]
MFFSYNFFTIPPLMATSFLAAIFLAAAPVLSMEIAASNAVRLSSEHHSSSTSRMFSLSENINRITRSVKELYSSAFNSKIETGESNKVLGVKCENVGDCSAVEFATCDHGKCSCDTNHTISKEHMDKCLKGVKLGDDCLEDVQCQKGDSGSVCMAFKCVCSANHSEKKGKCFANPLLGSSCVENLDCRHIPFAECVDNVCACTDAMLPGKHSNVCLSVAIPGERSACEEDIQCTAQFGDKSRCIMGFCECDHSYHASSGKCIPDLKLGSQCSTPSDCVVSRHTEEGNIRDCLNNTCSCVAGYKSTNEENFCVKAGDGYQLHASLAWILCVFVVPYLF